MILPTKHIAPQNSLLGIGAALLELLSDQQTVTRLWDQARTGNKLLTFQRFVLAVDLLFAIGAVELTDGILQRRTHS